MLIITYIYLPLYLRTACCLIFYTNVNAYATFFTIRMRYLLAYYKVVCWLNQHCSSIGLVEHLVYSEASLTHLV